MFGTDIHRDKDSYKFIIKSQKRIKKYISEDKYKLLFDDNARKLIS